MLRIAGQTAEPIELNIFVGHSGGVLVKNSKFFFLKHLKKKISTGNSGPFSLLIKSSNNLSIDY